jgi:Rod binding domain-containing protein
MILDFRLPDLGDETMRVTDHVTDRRAGEIAGHAQIEDRKTKNEDAKLRKACHDMESYFVGMLLKKMHESASKGGLFEEKSETATYREMFDDAVAAEIGKRGAFGIADTLYRELSVHEAATVSQEPKS